jgi:hypothetical protein
MVRTGAMKAPAASGPGAAEATRVIGAGREMVPVMASAGMGARRVHGIGMCPPATGEGAQRAATGSTARSGDATIAEKASA